jgi:hypothetical protein
VSVVSALLLISFGLPTLEAHAEQVTGAAASRSVKPRPRIGVATPESFAKRGASLVKNNGVVLGILMAESASRETCPIDVLLANYGETEFMCPEVGGLLNCVMKVRVKRGGEVPYTKMGTYRFDNEGGFDHRARIIYDPDEIRHWQFDLAEAFARLEAGEYLLSLKITVFFRDNQTKEFSKAVDIDAKDIPFTITSSQEARTFRHLQLDREGITLSAALLPRDGSRLPPGTVCRPLGRRFVEPPIG